MDIPSIINRNYYVVRATRSNRTWICEAERFDDKDRKLYYYYGTYELGSEEHKNNCYLSNSFYDILSSENDEVRLATMEEIDILMDILEKNGVVITLQEAKDKAKAPDLKGEDYSNKRFEYKIPDGYEFDTVDNNKIILKPKKPIYPKSCDECCKLLNTANRIDIYGYKGLLLQFFQKLLICRDAYWRIAGEEMELGKPWVPNWEDESQVKYMITTFNNELEFFSSIHSYVVGRRNHILSFPTIEMRDAFYENFKELIKECKELL